MVISLKTHGRTGVLQRAIESARKSTFAGSSGYSMICTNAGLAALRTIRPGPHTTRFRSHTTLLRPHNPGAHRYRLCLFFVGLVWP
jgi:hypothetical protein